MANDNSNILVAGDAVLTVALQKLPKSAWATTTDEELNAAFAGGEVGLITEDGESLAREVQTENLSAHQQANVRTLTSGGEITFNFTAMETNDIVETLWFGVDKAAGGYRDTPADAAQTVTFVHDVKDIQEGFKKRTRIVGVGLVTPDSEASFTRTAETGWPFKITVMGDLRYISSKEDETEPAE